MTDKLTRKQKDFVESYLDTGNGTQAALAAYDTENARVAAAIASENLTKPNIINALEEALPDDLLAQVHKEGLFATKPIYNDDGDLLSEEADFNARHKYLDSAYKLKGKYAAEKHLNVNIEVAPTPLISELTKMINQGMRLNHLDMGKKEFESEQATEPRNDDSQKDVV